MPRQRRQPAGYYRDRNMGAYYSDGSAAREIIYPERDPRSGRRLKRVRVRRVRPTYLEAERTASVSITLPLTILLVAAVIVTLCIGYRYLGLKSSLDVHMNTIKTLETELDTLKMENDALEKSIDTSVDLNHIYDVAVNELGMVHVGQDNVIRYDKTESEYVRQNEALPGQ